MNNRYESFSIFEIFYQEIKTEFGVSIHTLRSGNAREYLSQQFQKFMSCNGILHQISLPLIHVVRKNDYGVTCKYICMFYCNK